MKKRNVICNTGPLIALATINQLHILQALFPTITVSQIVHEEILAGGSTAKGGANYTTTNWITVTDSSDYDPLLRTLLDAGEASVITLAREESADLLLIDELKGRKIARTVYGLNVIGTVGILVQAKQASIIANIKPLINEMRNNGYWIHHRIVNQAMQAAKETH